LKVATLLRSSTVQADEDEPPRSVSLTAWKVGHGSEPPNKTCIGHRVSLARGVRQVRGLTLDMLADDELRRTSDGPRRDRLARAESCVEVGVQARLDRWWCEQDVVEHEAQPAAAAACERDPVDLSPAPAQPDRQLPGTDS